MSTPLLASLYSLLASPCDYLCVADVFGCRFRSVSLLACDSCTAAQAAIVCTQSDLVVASSSQVQMAHQYCGLSHASPGHASDGTVAASSSRVSWTPSDVHGVFCIPAAPIEAVTQISQSGCTTESTAQQWLWPTQEGGISTTPACTTDKGNLQTGSLGSSYCAITTSTEESQQECTSFPDTAWLDTDHLVVHAASTDKDCCGQCIASSLCHSWSYVSATSKTTA